MPLKIGNLVRPSIGIHANEIHEVVHIFEDGYVNIRPIEGEVMYESGVVTCDPKYLTEETIKEEYQEPTGYWFSTLGEAGKKRYRENHPDASNFGHMPGSSKYHHEKSKAHDRYAKFHQSHKEHHQAKYETEVAKRNPNEKIVSHHANAKFGHATEYHRHVMRSAHHYSLSKGGLPSSHIIEPG